MNERNPVVAQYEQIGMELDEALQNLDRHIAQYRENVETGDLYLVGILNEKLNVLKEKNKLWEKVPGTLRDNLAKEIDYTQSEIHELELIGELHKDDFETNDPYIQTLSVINQTIRTSNNTTEKSLALKEKNNLLTTWRAEWEDYPERPSYQLLDKEVGKTTKELIASLKEEEKELDREEGLNEEAPAYDDLDEAPPYPDAEAARHEDPPPYPDAEAAMHEDPPPYPDAEAAMHEDPPPYPDAEAAMHEDPPPYPDAEAAMHEDPPPYPHAEAERNEALPPYPYEAEEKKGMFARFKDYRQRKAIGRDFDQLYTETIRALLEQTDGALKSYGKFEDIELGKIDATTRGLRGMLEKYNALLLQKINSRSTSEKEKGRLLDKESKVLEQLDNIAKVEENITKLAEGFHPSVISSFGGVKYNNVEEGVKKFLAGVSEPEVARLGEQEAVANNRPATRLSEYWIENTITIEEKGIEIRTATVPVESERGFMHEIHFDAQQMKELDNPAHFPPHVERIGLHKTEVPNQHIMALARDMVEAYRADPRNQGEMVLEGRTLPKQFIKGFELYCKMQGYDYKLGSSTRSQLPESNSQVERQVKAAEHALTQHDPHFKSNPTIAALEQKTDKKMVKLGFG